MADFQEYPKAVQVDGITLIARDKEHEASLKAGKGDPAVLRAEQARRDAEAAEAQRVADDAARKAKEAKAAAALKPGTVEADPAKVDAEARRTQGRAPAPDTGDVASGSRARMTAGKKTRAKTGASRTTGKASRKK
jgi:hypothetical protein